MLIKILNIRKSNFATSKTLAFLDIQIDNLVIYGFKVVMGNNGKFLSYPREQGKDEKWYDIVRPVDIMTKQEIESYILKEYEKWLAVKSESENENVHTTEN